MSVIPTSSPLAAAQARRDDRFDALVLVTVTSGHNFWTGLTRNVSKGGLFVASDVTMPIGTVLSFAFQLDPDPTIHRVRGTVRWVRPPEASSQHLPTGMGVQLDELSDALLADIQRFTNAVRDSLFYDDEDDDGDAPWSA